MIENYVLGASAAITTATVIILLVLLSRHRELVREARIFSQLAKDLWEAMNIRLSNMDAKIIELMAKVDVYSVTVERVPRTHSSQAPLNVSAGPKRLGREESSPVEQPPVQSAPQATEKQILSLLAQGSKNSGQIRVILGKSREHTARLMKSLFDQGFVVRNDRNKPYVYEMTEKGRSYLLGS